MKHLTAVRLRIVLSAAMLVLVALIIGAFLAGYNYMQTVGQTASEHKAAALASENTVNSLQQLKLELDNQSTAIEQLEQLRTPNSLPQFDTEQSLRTITNQLGLGIQNVTFVSAAEDTDTPAASTTPPPTPARGEAGVAAPTVTTPYWGGSRNSRISFEFSRALSYNELIRFLHAVETSTPKLRLDGVSIPSGSTRESIELGTLTLEMATS